MRSGHTADIWRSRIARIYLSFEMYRLWTVLVALFAFRSFAQEFEVEGVTTYRQISGTGKTVTLRSETFTVFVRDCQWLIQTREERPGGTPAMWEIGQISPSEVVQLGIPSTPTNAIGSNRVAIPPLRSAVVFSNAVPVGCLDKTIAPLWIMFASHCFLRGRTNDLITPVYDQVAGPTFNPNLKQQARWSFLPKAPGLPSVLDYFNDGQLHSMSKSNLPSVFKLPKPYDQGFTNAICYATGVTNIGGLALPSGFVFERYMPANGRKSTDLRVMERVEASVTAVRSSCSRENLMPELSRKSNTVIVDRRSAPTNDLKLAVTLNNEESGGIWPKAEAVRKVEAERKKTIKNARIRPVLVVVFALILFTPLLLFFLKRGKNGKS